MMRALLATSLVLLVAVPSVAASCPPDDDPPGPGDGSPCRPYCQEIYRGAMGAKSTALAAVPHEDCEPWCLELP